MSDESEKTLTKACAQCPWRKSNHGKKHAAGFYTKANLRRLWNQIRGGGNAQSCHMTDPSHPDHVAAGAREGSVARECPGSVIVVLREVRRMAEPGTNEITPESVGRYLALRRRAGITKMGIAYWVVQRISMAGVPYVGGEKLPSVDVSDDAVGLPAQLAEG